MHEWIQDLMDVSAAGEPAVIVTVAGVRGSTPRELGAKMIVTRTQTIGTIGGGQLEYQSARVAVDMLDGDELALRSFPLGPSLGQCCGGVVEMLFEPVADGIPTWLRDLGALYGQHEPAVVATRISQSAPHKFVVTADAVYGVDEDAADVSMVARARELLDGRPGAQRNVQELYEPVVMPDFDIVVFGAGHVGAAVVEALARLDCNIRWIDNRPDIFRKVPRNVHAIEAAEPTLEVAGLPPGSYCLVMTHSHPLDFDICERILLRGDARYCGLIGSLTKRRRFEKRFREQGVPQAAVDSLVCPIGVDGINGKKPAEIAVAVAAEILRTRELAAAASAADYPGNVRPIGR